MHKLIPLLIGLILIASCDSTPERKPGDTNYPASGSQQARKGSEQFKPNAEVVGVNDGDTITVRMDSSGEQVRIRLATIDAPESNQPFGQASKQNLSRLVFGKKVKIVEMDRDQYGRVVAEVFADGFNVNLEQIKRGFAWHYKHHERQQTPEMRREYAAAEQVAKQMRLGLWRLQNPVPPWEWRRSTER